MVGYPGFKINFIAWVLLFSFPISLAQTYPAQASEAKFELEEAQIPKSPSRPPFLELKAPKYVPHCERFYLYQGKKFECDSNLGRDGEAFRPLMADVPSAIAELDTYQANLRKIRVAAYVSTAGILAVIAGLLISRPPIDPVSGAFKPGAYVMLGGFGVTVNSLIYGLSLVKTNEAHLSNAVNNFNAAHPDRAIELQFSTNVNF